MAGDHAGAFGLAAAGARARIGRYEVTRRLAVGGMAELFLARSVGIEGFEKQVVIKRILPQYARNSQMVDMFLDEARLAARIHHPNIAQVFDIGEEQGEFFFTMEYIRGEDLGAIMSQCAHAGVDVPLEHTLTIAIGAAAGLHHAHGLRDERGRLLQIVHRDVSPANVMVGFDGGVKLVDFGIAKARSRVHTTSTGGLKGKFAYMSPEQCRGEELDQRSDIFSLGIVLYELSTGIPLFDSTSAMRAMAQIQGGEIAPPSRTRADYPAELEAIVLRALRPRPSERYQSAGDLQLDLEAFAREHKLPISSLGLGGYLCELFSEHAPPDETLDRTADVILSVDVPLPNRAAVGDPRRTAAAMPAHVSTSAETGWGGGPAAAPRGTEAAHGPPPMTYAPALGPRRTEVAGAPPLTHAPALGPRRTEVADAPPAVTVVGAYAAATAGQARRPSEAEAANRTWWSGMLGVVAGVFLGVAVAAAGAVWLGWLPVGGDAARPAPAAAASSSAPGPSSMSPRAQPTVRSLAPPEPAGIAVDDSAAAGDEAVAIDDEAVAPDDEAVAIDDEAVATKDEAVATDDEPVATDGEAVATNDHDDRARARATTSRRKARARRRRARERQRDRSPRRDTPATKAEPAPEPTEKRRQWNLDSPLPPEG